MHIAEAPSPAELTRFAVGTFGVSALFWVAGAASEASLLTRQLPLSALMFVAPAVGLVIAVGARRAWRALRAPFSRFGAELRSAVAWLPVMPLVVLAAARPSWSGASAEAVPLASLVLLALGFLISSLLEQLGWMWFAAEGLAPRWGVLPASLTAGTLWAAVHVIPWSQAGRSVAWVVGQSLFSVVFLSLIVEAYLIRHSLLSAVALQASYDATWVGVASVGGTYDPLATTLGTLAVLIAVRIVRVRRTSTADDRRAGA